MRSPTPALAAILPALVGAFASAQGEPTGAEVVRSPMVGTVTDADDRPIADVAVTLVWSPPGGPENGPTDIVEVTTDKRGRFIARLMPQEFYSAWAVRELAPGRHETSIVHEGIAAGGDRRIVVDRPIPPRTLTIVGSEPWAALGPFAIDVAPDAQNIAFFRIGEHGDVPPLPQLGLAVVRTDDGSALYQSEFRDGARDALPIRLPPPATTLLRVLDAEGRPIPGATVLHPSRPTSPARHSSPERRLRRVTDILWRTAGTTDADGNVAVMTPLRQTEQWSLLVRHPGMAESVVTRTWGMDRTTNIDGEPQGNRDGRFTVRMRGATRLLVTNGRQPLARAEVMLTAKYHGNIMLERAFAAHLDAAGTCEVPLPLEPLESMLQVRTAPGKPWQLLRIPLHGDAMRVDLSHQRRLDLQFLDRSGGPARGLAGVLIARGSNQAGNQQVVVSTDQAGRLERTLGTDGWLLFVSDGELWQRYAVPPLSDYRVGEGGEFVETLTCEPVVTREFVITNVADRPIAGCYVRNVALVVDPRPDTGIPPALAAVIGGVLTQAAEGRVSDAEGRLVIPFFEGLEAVAVIEDPRAGTQRRVRLPAVGTANAEMLPTPLSLPQGLLIK